MSGKLLTEEEIRIVLLTYDTPELVWALRHHITAITIQLARLRDVNAELVRALKRLEDWANQVVGGYSGPPNPVVETAAAVCAALSKAGAK